jgi:hypothetical protein
LPQQRQKHLGRIIDPVDQLRWFLIRRRIGTVAGRQVDLDGDLLARLVAAPTVALDFMKCSKIAAHAVASLPSPATPRIAFAIMTSTTARSVWFAHHHGSVES